MKLLPLIAAALAAPLLALIAAPAVAQPACGGEAMTTLQKRLVAKSQQGPDELRRFIQATQPIYQLSWHDTQVWLQSRQGGATCTSSADPARSGGAAEGTRTR